MTITNFNSGSLINNTSVTSANYDGWTFGSGSLIDIANVSNSDMAVLLNQSSGRSILLNYSGNSVTSFYFKSSDESDFKLNSFNFDNGPSGASTTLTVAGYRGGSLIVSAEVVNMAANDSTGNISYTKLDNIGSIYSGTLSFNSAFNNIDEIRFVFDSAVELTIDDIDISAPVVPPTITSATYDASTNSFVVIGTNMAATVGAANDINVSKLTLTGQGGATYTLTSSNVELDSATQFTVALNSADQINVEGLLNKNGTAAVGGTIYNIAAAADWNPALSGNADTTGNGVTVSNVVAPSITSATYDAATHVLTVTGANLVGAIGANNDITVNKLTLTGDGGATYTLTSSNVEVTSATAFSVTLNATDQAAVEQILNKNGTSSTGGTTFNLAAADDWNTVIGNADISDALGNGITVSNVAVPAITSATYDASTGSLVVTGTGFKSASGAANDIVANKFTFTGEGGSTYTLTDSANVEITSGTSFTLTLSSTDKAALNLIANKNGTSATGGTTYNLAAAEDWAAGADAAVVVADTTGNGITVSNVAVPAISSATYDASTGALVVTGTGFKSASGASNDIVASKFTFTGEGGSTYTLTDSANVEITSGTSFTLTLSSTDKAALGQIATKNGTSATGGTTYNLAAAEDWAAGADAAVIVADLTGNGVTVSNVAVPAITSAAYDYSTNTLVVTGTGFLQKSGAANDIDISKFTFTGEGGGTYTLTSATDVEIQSGTQFTITLAGADLTQVEALLNKDGTSSASGTTYNLAAAEDWAAGADAAVVVADLTGNGVTVSNWAAPTVTSATLDASTGVLVLTGTNFVSASGVGNDLIASKLSLKGEGGSSYTLTDSADVDVTSATSASITLSATDRLHVLGLLNKNGTTSGDATTYNLSLADDWMAASPVGNDIADETGNGITVSNMPTPTITSATYSADSGVLTVTGTNFFRNPGASNDIDISTLTLTGGVANTTYTITSSSDVEITSANSFTVTLSGADKTAADALLDQLGTTSSGGSTYNLAVADDWLTAAETAANIADAVNTVTVTINPKLSSATYDAATGVLVVSGSNLQANGSGADIDASRITLTGEGGTSYTLTDTADVEIDSISQFTVTLSATDKAALNQILNKNGTTSTGGTTFNLAAADDWNTNVTSDDTSDATNALTVSNVAAPAITSATYDASTGALVVTGTGFSTLNGASNDIVASKFTFTGEGGSTYTLTDSANVEITSGTSFTLTLSSTDKAALGQIATKNGTSATGGTTYNLAAAEDWAAGADAAVIVADLTGNGVTVSNVAVPAITSATYNVSTGVLVVTGSDLLHLAGAANDIIANRLRFFGQGALDYTLTDTPDVDITSGTSFTMTMSANDKAALALRMNKDGTSATDGTTYNLGMLEDWIAGADSAVVTADLLGNGVTVTGNDTTAPLFTSATANANSLVLLYTDANLLDSVNVASTGAFTVHSGGVANAVTGVTVNAAAKTVTLTLGTAIGFGQAVTVAYTDPTAGNDANAIQDAVGNDAASLPVTAVTNNTPDTTAPVLNTAEVNGNQLVLGYTEATTLDATHPAGIGDFAVTANGAANAVIGVTVNAAAKTITLTLATAVTSDQAVTVAYTDPTAGNDANAIQDAAGNDAASFAATLASNLTPPPAPPEPPPPPAPPPPPPPPPSPVGDQDGIPDAQEDTTPGLPSSDGNTPVAGDGNGDGIKDSQQVEVASLTFLLSPTAQTNPGNAPPTFTTLVASSQDGKVDSGNSNSRITSLGQKDAPSSLPDGVNMPIGLVFFTVDLAPDVSREQFSLYVDPTLGVNGYWKQDSTGTWVNLASAPYGGKMVMEGGRLRLDFQIEDGGAFDADGKVNGAITDPGAPAHLPLSIVGHAPELFDRGFWF